MGAKLKWQCSLYNTEFELEEVKDIILYNKLHPKRSQLTNKGLHTFFTDRKGNFSLVSIRTEDIGY